MKVLVTGGAGFIGSNLVDRLLADGHTVTVLDNFSTGRPDNLKHHKDNPQLSLHQVDVANNDTIDRYFKGIDWVMHLASLADIVPSIIDPQEYYRANVTGTINVLEAAKKCEVKRFIYTASSSCYGIPDAYPTEEDADIRTEYPYALTKYLGELCVLHWGNIYKLPVVSLRLFNVYGPRARTSGTYGAVMGVFLAQKLAQKPFTVVGDGTQKRDFTYVDDVADAFVSAAASNVTNEIFNIGSGSPQSVNTLVELLQGERIYIPKRPGEPDCTWANIDKIKNTIGWNPKTSFKEGVNKVLEHIDYWRSAPVWTPEKIEVATKDWFKYLSR
ncbi:MAG: SDR family oxidoreductase [Candidatus Ancaeobacter aquaticus]|nr:SDR family oxidoreductase [Candidatus Ancaeobacter aquaticus]